MKIKSVKTIFILCILFIVFCLLVSFVPRNPFSKEEVIFQVTKGEGAKAISVNLQKAGLITFWPAFPAQVLLSGERGSLRAGFYSLSPSMRISEIAGKISSGDAMKVGITVFEGSDLEQVHLYTNVPVELEELDDYRANFDFLADAPQGVTLEGYLFPDTYYFDYGDTEKEVAKTMLANFGKKLTPTLRVEIKKQGKTIYEIIKMASLIEREVQTPEDKKMISGILWKRLETDMPLQVDVDLWTYKNRGLPPVPICSPGLESIMAAIYPQESAYWYYLSAPDGTTIFSKTLKEHNSAIVKYLK